MDAALYIKMLSDESVTNLKKMQYKYSPEDVTEFVHLVKDSVYTTLPLPDFKGNPCVYLKPLVQLKSAPAKMLLMPQSGSYGKEAMEHFNSIGTIIYLNLPYEEIEQRLGNLEERGVTIKKGQTLKDLYNERTPLYKKYANIVINCQGKTIREIVEEISATSNIQEN